MNSQSVTYQNFYFSGNIPGEKRVPGEKKCVKYYPFGMRHIGYNNVTTSNGNSVAQKIKFGGKEYQDELNLNWYDVSARNYDPALGRWMNIDPLAEKFVETSPYTYAKNNPIFFVDPDGKEPVPGPFTGKGWTTSNGTIRVHRITAGQRYALNVYYATSIAFTGPIGTAKGLYDTFTKLGNSETSAGAATQLAADGASRFLLTDAANQGFGTGYDASGNPINNAKNIRGVARATQTGLRFLSLGTALASDSSPTKNEMVSKWTFQFAEGFIKGGNINIAQEGLFDVSDENATVEGVESRLNAIFMGINIFLTGQDFDLSTKKGKADAAKYITDNAKYIAALSKLIYRHYNNKKENDD